MSHFIRDHLERNYASVMAGKYEERRAYVDQIPHAGRMAEKAMLNASRRNPEFVGKVLGLQLPPNTVYAGAGSIHTVIKTQDYVDKIHRGSAFMNETNREKLRDALTEQHGLMSKYLGNMVIAQVSVIERHPLAPKKTAILSTQEAISFENPSIFTAYGSEIDVSALEDTLDRYPGIESSLNDFTKAAIRLYENTGMLVDVSGQDNIVIAKNGLDGNLICMDGLPISDPNLGDVQRIMGQIDHLNTLF